MKIVIAGGGKVGYSIAHDAVAEGHDVTIIDSNRKTAENLSAAIDCMVICGSGSELAVQRAANVAHSDLLIAVTHQDELNILCCMLARKLGCPNTIARIHNPEYTEELALLRKDLGLSMAVNPDMSTAMEIFRQLQLPGFLKRESFVKSRVEMVSLQLAPGNPLCGRKLMELPHVLKQRVLVCVVRRGEETIIPGGAFELREGDEISLTAPVSELARLQSSLGLRKKQVKDVMIIGGSDLAVSLADMLHSAGTRVRIIESNSERCETLAERLPEAMVICADGTSQAVLRSENISRMDAVVSLTPVDEENVFISMFAHLQGVPQAITKINRSEYAEICRSCGIRYAVSPKRLCAQEVNRYLRAMQSTNAESVLSLYPLADGHAEALEFEVTEDVPHLGERLAEVQLRENTLIACITREGSVIFPGGSDSLQKGDIVIVVTAGRGSLAELSGIFADVGRKT